MSVNIDHPNNDISTDGGVKPTIGGGPVSAWAMDTAIATATYWSDLATINLGSLDNADASFRLLLSCGEGTSLTTVDLLLVCKQTTTISSTESKIEVLSLTNTANVTHDDFKIIASATTKGTDIHLWMQSETSVKWRVIELSRQINSDSSTPINYNNGSTWTVTTPTGTVDVTSDWAGSGPLTSTSLSNSTGTVYYEKSDDGFVDLHIRFNTITTTADATTLFTMPSGYRHGVSGKTLEEPLTGIITGGIAGKIRMSDVGVISLYNYDAGSSATWAVSFRYRARA